MTKSPVLAALVALAVLATLPTSAAGEPGAQRKVIQFAKGSSSSQVRGSVKGEGDVEYTISARAGQTLAVALSSANTSLNFNLSPPQRIETPAALITRPFDYGTVISYSFESAHWQATRFSDGTRYGVWYGALDLATTVHETAWHWYRFVQDSFPDEDRDVVTDRRAFDVRCETRRRAIPRWSTARATHSRRRPGVTCTRKTRTD